MAFFASIEDLPAAKASWKDKRPDPPEPPVPPPPPPPQPRVRKYPPQPCTGAEYINGLDMGHMCLEKFVERGWKIPQGMIIYRPLLDQAAIDAVPADRRVLRTPTGATGSTPTYWTFYVAGDEELIQEDIG